MNYGILEEPHCRDLFNEINNRRICKEKCWSERGAFEAKDKKEHGCRSNLVPGFSFEKISIPIDVLIVGEAHGGGEDDDFRKQKDLDCEVSKMARFYRDPPDKSFHQQQVRILLDGLDNMGRKWVFTDLVKCFVWHGSDKENDLKGRKNWRIAIRHCGTYLEEQIGLLQPRKILGLGGTVAQYFRQYFRRSGHQSVYVPSLFPSQWTADRWVVTNGWEPVVPKLAE